MSQILKEDTRNKILESAKEEFLEKGYENASLRRIALKAHMTVGNLYRYFENKEDINVKIVEPCLLKIEKLINDETDNQLSFFKNNKNFNLDKEDMIKALDNIIDKIIDIYDEYKAEFQILMMDSKVSIKLRAWFSNLIRNLIKNNYPFIGLEKELTTMSETYSVAVFSGFKELLRSDFGKERIKLLSKIYFRSYIYMLNSDIRKMIGK